MDWTGSRMSISICDVPLPLYLNLRFISPTGLSTSATPLCLLYQAPNSRMRFIPRLRWSFFYLISLLTER